MTGLRSIFRSTVLAVACLFAIVPPAPLRAQVPPVAPGAPAPNAAPAALQGIDIEEKSGQSLPLDAVFTDESGKEVRLRDYFHKDKPVVLQLSYFGCPMLCSLVSNGLVESLNELSFTMGKEFEVINLSFDPKETPALGKQKKASFVEAYNRPAGAEAWHFLTGKPESIDAVIGATGFKYKWIEASKQFSHPAALILLTPDGKVSRYLYGIKYAPQTLRLSLVEASQGKVGSTVDKVLLTCFHYDATVGKYTPVAMGIMRVAGVIMVLAVVGVIGGLLVREARHRRTSDEAQEAATEK